MTSCSLWVWHWLNWALGFQSPWSNFGVSSCTSAISPVNKFNTCPISSLWSCCASMPGLLLCAAPLFHGEWVVCKFGSLSRQWQNSWWQHSVSHILHKATSLWGPGKEPYIISWTKVPWSQKLTRIVSNNFVDMTQNHPRPILDKNKFKIFLKVWTVMWPLPTKIIIADLWS